MIELIFAAIILAQDMPNFEQRWLDLTVTPPPESPKIAAIDHVEYDRVCGKRGRYYYRRRGDGRRMWKCRH
jgi:hypothetical protein